MLSDQLHFPPNHKLRQGLALGLFLMFAASHERPLRAQVRLTPLETVPEYSGPRMFECQGPPGQASYYVLLQGNSVVSITNVVDVEAVRPTGATFLRDLRPSPSMGFYVARLVLFGEDLASDMSLKSWLSQDTDGDGMPNLWELQHGLSPSSPTDSILVPLGDVRNWLQIYTDDVANAKLPLASFPYTATNILADATSVSIPVIFDKPFIGFLTYRLSGTAVAATAMASGDYEQPSGSVYCNNTIAVSIQIDLVPKSDIEINRSIVIALAAPPLDSQGYTISKNTSVATVHIVQSTQGLYVGMLSVTNGVFTGAQPVKMALRSGSGGGTAAFFDVTGNPLLGNRFTVPVQSDANGFQLSGAQFPTTVTNTPWGRSLEVTLSFGVTSNFTNSTFLTPVTIALAGLTSSGVSYLGNGTLTLTRAHNDNQ